MRFEWDARKARSNIAKHGESFELAITAFDDPFALVVVFTKRVHGEVYRLISARRANRRKRRRYEDARQLPV